ncbi:MAG: aminoacyl-tRNA hydrolase [Magnetococcales bacterium]|nr:aminoacyl-tRNA hydrolase [Magnetococcales bacterium]
MNLLVGLGNPGERYRGTRHNLGWDVLQEVTRAYGLSAGSNRFQGLFGSGRVGDHRVYWLFPETYMNLAGQAVGEAARYFKIEPDQVVVFHDDLDLACGVVRMKVGGGNGGHNGLKSIQQHLGTPAFVRIRLGIGRPPPVMDPAQFVLSHWTQEEQTLLTPPLTDLPKAMPHVLAGNLPGAMNQLYNPPTGKKTPKAPKQKRDRVKPPKAENQIEMAFKKSQAEKSANENKQAQERDPTQPSGVGGVVGAGEVQSNAGDETVK